MFASNKLALAVRLAVFGAAAVSTVAVNPVFAEASNDVERIQVTGSSIKRTDLEGSLPVQVITREDIDQLGITSVPDLVAQMPAMSGFTTSGDSVGGGGGGLNTASIHDLGAPYTLVLLNGRRLAPTGSGSTIDLNTIPLAAVEQVEVLTDGASALYGSDAIAGVVNFIMKDNYQGVDVSARYDRPQESGGESFNLSITAGFGDLYEDGYNVMVAYSHDRQDQLASIDREFAETGTIVFEHQGQDLLFFNGSPNAIPANARTRILDDEGKVVSQRTWNPYEAANGSCAENNVMPSWSTECWFDYTSTIEIYPESDRDSVFLKGQLALTDDLIAYSELTLSKYSVTSRIAPYPTGHFNVTVHQPPIDS